MTKENPASNPVSVIDRVIVFLATGFYISLFPNWIVTRFKDHSKGQKLLQKKWTGAGLLGSVEGVLMYLLIPWSGYNSLWAILIAFALSVFVSGRAENVLKSHDDSRIVIDEWVGAWIAVWGLPRELSLAMFFGFVLFRFFDVFKGPIGRRMQNLPGGWGITLDDVYAGVAANLSWRICFKFVTSF